MALEARALDIPAPADGDPASYEMLRMWSAGEGQCVTLRVDPALDAAVWGIMLFDLVRHVARAYEQQGAGPAEAHYKRVLLGFVAEMQHPTDTPH